VFHGVHEAFPVDSSNGPGIESAVNWAERYGSGRGYFKDVHPNDNMTDVIIVDMECRTGNSKVYKALVKNKYYVDLRPDVVLDIMVNGSIQNGVIQSPMLWVRAKGGMRLTRAGSPDHIDSLDAKKPKPIVERIELGYSYTKPNSSEVVSVFNVNNTKHFQLVNIHAGDSWNNRRPEVWEMHYEYIPIYISANINEVEAHESINQIRSINSRYFGGVDIDTLDITYSKKTPLDKTKAEKFILDTLEYVSNIYKMELEPKDPRPGTYSNDFYANIYNLLLLANQMNLPIKNCHNFDEIANWVNSFPIVLK
jgi:hypothetical protein